ncbi:extracellular solute-binding protein [Rhizobium sp. SL86]|uniref:extracellular solute-binding protein n=1 Tax=Rhizobium sp. SL86 TaxID=2995148 RepID=UPI0022750AAA|nr:extracellular solute-binding protein [Rhizobium sp. SL86]MCY1666703.1 extracellular solute-binding protein [Rhizobium sp. SL86]
MLKTVALLMLATALPLAIIPTEANAKDLSQMNWDEIVAQAKEEGQVNWFHWYFQDRFREQVKAFEAEYGIKVTIPDGDGKANMDKMLAERSRPQGDIDAISLGGSALQTFKAEELLYGPLKPVLPDGTRLRYSIEGTDNKGYAPAFWGNQTGIAYNPARISVAELPHTLDEFVAFMKQNPGELGFNTENGGSGPAFIESVARAMVKDIDYTQGASAPDKIAKLAPAWTWFKDHRDGYIITASNADSVTRLNGGEFKLIAAWEDQIAGLQRKGEISNDIKMYIPSFGMPGGGNVVAIPANAKHKAAALVLINWLTSAKTQTEFAKSFGIAPQHPDADSSVGLIPAADRAFSTVWAAKPFGDDIKKAFISRVLQN